jgi:hypothetical protein
VIFEKNFHQKTQKYGFLAHPVSLLEFYFVHFKVDPSGKIILFENGGVPWKEHFLNIEKEEGLEKLDISYALFADNSGSWRRFLLMNCNHLKIGIPLEGVPKNRHLVIFWRKISKKFFSSKLLRSTNLP